MSDSRDIVYAMFGVGFGVWSFVRGLGTLQKKRFIESIPTSTVRGLAIGLVELSGKAKKTTPFVAPLSRTECAFYRYTIERYESSGRSGRWVLVAHGDSVFCPFCLDDSTGQILVLPQGAEFVMPPDFTYTTGLGRPIPENIMSFMEQNHVQFKALFGTYSMRFNEWYIKHDEEVFVVGTAQKRTTVKDANPGDDQTDVIIAKGESAEIFIISDESQKQVVSTFSWQAFWGIWGGAALSLALLAYLLFRFGVWARF